MDSNRVKKMMKQVEDAMAAVSFAEEGEFETAESLLKRERRVLLALREGHIDQKTLMYALNTCQRVGAHLDILYVSSAHSQNPATDPVLRHFASKLKAGGVEYRFIQRTGCLKQEIIEYTNKEHEVLFVVVESPESLDAECRKKDSRLSELWQKLRCPLVVVSEARA